MEARGPSNAACRAGRAVAVVIAVITAISVAISVRIVAVVIGIAVTVTIVVRVIPPPWPPRIKADVKSEPGASDEAPTMAMPKMVVIVAPVGMPVGRMLRDDVVVPVRRKPVSVSYLARAGHPVANRSVA